MRVVLRKNFKKQFKKLTNKIRHQSENRLKLFEQNPFDPILNNHELSGEYSGTRSINITGDIRAIYFEKTNTAIFIAIGTHSELYS